MKKKPQRCLGLILLIACGGPTSEAPSDVMQPLPSEPIETPESLPVEAVDDRPVIDVTTPHEFIEALGSDRILRLTAAEYRLDALWSDAVGNVARHASGYRPSVSPPTTGVVSWSDPYDGWELLIHHVQRLSIVGAHDPPPRILTSPRGSWVLSFANASGLELSNLTIGHTNGGYCLGRCRCVSGV